LGGWWTRWATTLAALAVVAGPVSLDARSHQEKNVGGGGQAAAPTLATLRSRWPVPGPINSDFGTRRSSSWRPRVHTGVDIGAAHGTLVRAPAKGRVAFAGWRSGYGRTVVIDHGHHVHTVYAHLSKLGVRRGQLIQPGSAIGSTGRTGYVTGPHLHYEIRVNGRPLNPRNYLTGSRRIR